MLYIWQLPSISVDGQVSPWKISCREFVGDQWEFTMISALIIGNQHAMGNYPRVPRSNNKLCYLHGNSLLPGVYRSQPVPWVHSPHFALVPQIWAATAFRYMVLRKFAFVDLRQPYRRGSHTHQQQACIMAGENRICQGYLIGLTYYCNSGYTLYSALLHFYTVFWCFYVYQTRPPMPNSWLRRREESPSSDWKIIKRDSKTMRLIVARSWKHLKMFRLGFWLS